jgi:hypothetical protein
VPFFPIFRSFCIEVELGMLGLGESRSENKMGSAKGNKKNGRKGKKK